MFLKINERGFNIKKILPANTNISTYFEFEDRIFENMVLPDGRHLIKIVHTWGDGEIMKFNGFEYSDGIARTGINPLHIVNIYEPDKFVKEIEDDIKNFLEVYAKGRQEGTTNGNC